MTFFLLLGGEGSRGPAPGNALLTALTVTHSLAGGLHQWAWDLADLGSLTDKADGSGQGSGIVPAAKSPPLTPQAVLCFPLPVGAHLSLLLDGD